MNPYPYLQNKFWEKRAEFIISSVQADIYNCLLMLFNKARWPKEFKRTNESISDLVGVAKNTFKIARKRLEEIGLIQYFEGKKGHPTTYILPDLEIYRSSLSKLKGSKFDTQTDPYIDPYNVLGSGKGSALGSGKGSKFDTQTDPIIKHKTNTKTNTVNNKDSSKKKVSFPPTERDGLPMIEVKENVFMTEKEIEIVKKEFGQEGYDWIIKKIAYQQEKNIQEKQKPYTHILKVIDNWAGKAYRKHLIEEKELKQREERLNNQNNKSYGTGKNNQNNKLTADDIQTAYNGVDDICGVV